MPRIAYFWLSRTISARNLFSWWFRNHLGFDGKC